ncbi:D-alanyl-D-alanine carboxypeptidase/D-alanyl-D-alanine-endopeptidase [Flavilitoribacter nigricans]|uniref:D-alanyl-D-alanine carboxypeptidase n=1 Tax=Flavilitoribacter nigricans (strain ATCC 23147 / DSM 23189 / NBRC 102662 / NCIMB 1420 / SS-2) TaxID=1122177 RepID=A0A2D0N773_FLAN2|nr:D-alanyl-D-alanine carboxypeptidase [Flavilitoribacter nigricans]PHN04364.1 D-alanyl-D-alanine carboxypeptidase [Flavilitoribacter nigricans DSM 23189 = NBRC 102662]
MSARFSDFLKYYGLLISAAVLLTACQGTKSLTSKERRSLDQLVDENPVFKKSFTGFALYDPAEKEWLYQKDAHLYYTPASNTKILTLYTALEVLGDSFPLLHYERRQDSLVFWGSGNPALLDPTLPMSTDAVAFLQAHDGPLFFTHAAFNDRRFGSGWAWDDFPYYYQPEKVGLPVYGNFVEFIRDKQTERVKVWPKYFERFVEEDPELYPRSDNAVIVRDEHQNRFRLNAAALTGKPYRRYVPFHYTPQLVLGVLQDTLSRNVYYLPKFSKNTANVLSSPRPDTLYRKLMQQSDNFIAEQLLLMCSDKLFGEMNTRRMISYAQDSLLAAAPDRYEWVDGSGLSRYNLFTPRSVVYVLEQLYQKMPEKWLFEVFPAGGKEGTIQNWYGPADGGAPFVFAKTGSLRHRHCLSGYVRTRSGKTLIFSFMHNNFTGSSNAVKEQMDLILRWINAEL